MIDRLDALPTSKKKTGPAQYCLTNPGPMKREYLDQLAVWFHAEVEGFKAKGASEDILTEPGFTSLLVETLFKRHIDEIRSDPAFVEEIIITHCLTATPSELRKMAAQDRERRKLEFAYYLEFAADQRERGEFAKLASETAAWVQLNQGYKTVITARD
jgi:hypothetical protein